MGRSTIMAAAVAGSGSPVRRNLVVAAAIEVLAQRGAKGLSHRQVDRQLDWPAGSTSNFFRRRDDLLIAVAQDIVRLDAANLAFAHDLGESTRFGPETFTGHMVRLMEKWLRPTYRNRLMAGAEILLETTRNPHVLQQIGVQLEINEGLYRQIFDELGASDPTASARLFSFSVSSFYMGTCVARHLPDAAQVRDLVSSWVQAGLQDPDGRAHARTAASDDGAVLVAQLDDVEGTRGERQNLD